MPEAKNSSAFVSLASLPARDIIGGVAQGRYTGLNRMTIGEIRLKAGTVIPMHNHPHEQITYMLEGRFEFTIGDETSILEPGVAGLIPADVMHGGKTLTECRVIDLFAPMREEYR